MPSPRRERGRARATRARLLVPRQAALGAALLAAGCLDDGAAGPDAGPARLALTARVAATLPSSPSQADDAVLVRLAYDRGDLPDGSLGAATIPLPGDAQPGATVSRPLEIDLGPCLADPAHTPEGRRCRITAHVALRVGGRLYDETVVGPFEVGPGETAEPASVTLYEVASVEVAAPTGGRLYPGGTLQLAGRVLDARGEPVEGRPIVWSSGATAVATVDAATGLVTAVAPGTAVVAATAGGRTGELPVRVRARPVVRVAPAAAFEIERGRAAPAAVELPVTSDADGEIAELAIGAVHYEQPEGEWLSASLAADVTPSTLVLRPSRTDLPVGTYTAVVPVTGADVAAPAGVRVTYTVRETLLDVAPATLVFSATSGAEPPAPRTVSVTAGGTSAGPVTVQIGYGSAQTEWLEAVVTGGAHTPTTVTVRPTTVQLAPGTYSAEVQISAVGTGNSPRTVAVTYTVPPLTLASSPGAVAFDLSDGMPPAQVVTFTPSRPPSAPMSAPTVRYAGASGWLDVVATGSPGVFTVRPNLTFLDPGTYTAQVDAAVDGGTATTTVTYVVPDFLVMEYMLIAHSGEDFHVFLDVGDSVRVRTLFGKVDETPVDGVPVRWLPQSLPGVVVRPNPSASNSDAWLVATPAAACGSQGQLVAEVAGGLRNGITMEVFVGCGGTARRQRPSGGVSPAVRRQAASPAATARRVAPTSEVRP